MQMKPCLKFSANQEEKRVPTAICGSTEQGGKISQLFFMSTHRDVPAIMRRRSSRFSGYLHTDGYAGYHKLAERKEPAEKGITLVGCWAHARRKYDEALKALGAKESPAAVTIHTGLEYCNKLFKIEEEIKVLSPEERIKLPPRESKASFGGIFRMGGKDGTNCIAQE